MQNDARQDLTFRTAQRNPNPPKLEIRTVGPTTCPNGMLFPGSHPVGTLGLQAPDAPLALLLQIMSGFFFFFWGGGTLFSVPDALGWLGLPDPDADGSCQRDVSAGQGSFLALPLPVCIQAANLMAVFFS